MDRSNKQKADNKVVILGDSGVGKTCLIRRYIEGGFSENAPNTIGAAFFLKQWNSKNIALWDTAGQEEFRGLTSFYCRNANAVILCFDICNRQSYDALLSRHSRLLESVHKNCVMVFVGTKSDLINKSVDGKVHKRSVSIEEAMNKCLDFTEQYSSLKHPRGILPVFETSSKNNTNVEDVFEYIFETLVPGTSERSKTREPSPSGIFALDKEHSGQHQKEHTRKCC